MMKIDTPKVSGRNFPLSSSVFLLFKQHHSPLEGVLSLYVALSLPMRLMPVGGDGVTFNPLVVIYIWEEVNRVLYFCSLRIETLGIYLQLADDDDGGDY